mmetsp:Transcript_61460/g.143073  ORF Transcript_61460/g.143073 Transcript_61460/m.143073 type:complete len:212 (+) Transcript_61460:95-730(+)
MGASCHCERYAGCKVVIGANHHRCDSTCSDVTTSPSGSRGMLNHRLLFASRDDNITELKLAIEQGAYLETRRPFVMRPKPPADMETPGVPKKRRAPREGLTPLMYAAKNGSVAATRLLLDAKALIHARDEDGLQPLHLAASSGVQDVCSLLISNGAARDVVDDHGQRAVDYVPEDCCIMRADREAWEALLGPRSSHPSPDKDDAPETSATS